jgi:hypothetical protein
MKRDLRGDFAGEQLATPENRHGGFVARGFDRQDQRGCRPGWLFDVLPFL